MKYLAVVLAVLQAVPVHERKVVLDSFLDRLEDKYAANAAVIRAIDLARRVLDIPDDIGGDLD